MKTLIPFRFHGETLHFYEGRYGDGTPALRILDATDDVYAVLTVALPPGAPALGPNEYYIKTWSENAEVAAAVLKTGMFKDTGRRVATGYVEAQVWERT